MAKAVGRARARREYLEAIDALDEADRRLRAQLTRARHHRARLRSHLLDGGDAAGCRDLLDLRRATDDFDGAVGDLIARRGRAQRAMYRLSAAEGMNPTQIARMWGVSRQFVSRMLLRGDDPKPKG